MTTRTRDGSPRVAADGVEASVETRTALVWCSNDDVFGPPVDVTQSIDDTVRRLTSDGELVDVALAPVSFASRPDDVSGGTTCVLVTAIVRVGR